MATEKRLIDANALLVDLRDELGFETLMFTAEQNKYIDYGLRVAIKDVKYQPTVDAVEVVRCKDCKNWRKTGQICGWCTSWEQSRLASGYCHCGERVNHEES